MNELIITLISIWNLPEFEGNDPKGKLCSETSCIDVQCACCPFDSEIHFMSPDEHFVTQIHKTSEVMNHETRNSTPD